MRIRQRLGDASLEGVFTPFGRRKKDIVAPKLKPRSAGRGENVNKVNIAELTPDLPRYLGQAAYLQLSNYETITGAIAGAPSTAAKAALVKVSRVSLAKLTGLLDEIDRGGDAPEELMEYFAAPIDAFRASTRGGDWHETVVTSYITAGMLSDFFLALAGGLPDAPRQRITPLLRENDPAPIIVELLRSEIDAQPLLASRLALWGRRLVGDTLLVARSALAVPGGIAPDEARLEPVFTELIAAHTRRMDVLGLTA